MKKLILTLAVAISAYDGFGQGLVKWANSASFAITTNGAPSGLITRRTTGNLNTYFIASLLVSTNGSAFAPLFYTTNSAALDGVISPGSSTTLPFDGGTVFQYRVAVWSYAVGGLDYATVLANLIFNDGLYSDTTPQSINQALAGLWFGYSGIGTATAATFPATPTDLWGANPLIQGFQLNAIVVPEPTSLALAGLGAASLLIFRKRKQ